MNAPLPEHVRKALETVTLDDNLRSRLRRRHMYAGGVAERGGFGVEPVQQGGAV